jgi:hypothetical protein
MSLSYLSLNSNQSMNLILVFLFKYLYTLLVFLKHDWLISIYMACQTISQQEENWWISNSIFSTSKWHSKEYYILYVFMWSSSWWLYGSWIYNYLCNPITNKVVRSIPADGEVYPIQQYVIKFVSELWQVGGFLRVLRFSPLKKPRSLRYNWYIVKSGVKHHNLNIVLRSVLFAHITFSLQTWKQLVIYLKSRNIVL